MSVQWAPLSMLISITPPSKTGDSNEYRWRKLKPKWPVVPTWSMGEMRYWSEGAPALGPNQRWSLAATSSRRHGNDVLSPGLPEIVHTGTELSTSSVAEEFGMSSAFTRAEK